MLYLATIVLFRNQLIAQLFYQDDRMLSSFFESEDEFFLYIASGM